MKMSLASKVKEANTALIINGKLDQVGDFFTHNYTVHLTDHVIKGGHNIVQSTLGALRHAFPDIQMEIDILLEGNNRIAWQRTLRATHKKAFKGFPASGLQIVWRDMVTSQFRDGLISEEWVITDLAEQLLLSRKHKS